MRRFMICGAALALAGVSFAWAQAPALPTPPDQLIAMRQAMMDLQSGVLGAMKATVEAKADVKGMKPGADGLIASAKVIPAMFPTGTEKAHNTKAKAEIWSDWPTFQKDSEALVAAAEKLAPLAEANDKAGFAAQFAEVGKTCGACHRQFKEKD